jgi:hypothetical protein
MLIYKPLPDGDERGPAFWEHYVPDGSDKMARYGEKGWLFNVPADSAIYNDAGELVNAGKKPAKEAKA